MHRERLCALCSPFSMQKGHGCYSGVIIAASPWSASGGWQQSESYLLPAAALAWAAGSFQMVAYGCGALF